MTGKVSAPRIAIVGGGFTGAAVATHLALRTPAALAVDVIEPRAMLGGGVAYSSLDPAHRTNVAAARMSLFPDDESHFTRWLTDTRALEDDPDAVLADGRIYPRRRIFGNYVADQLDRAARTGRAMVRHLRDRAIEIGTSQDGWAIGLASGRTIGADLVVLAVSHPPPQAPENVYCAIAEHRAFVPDPWALDALKPIMPMDTVLIMGTALSMADVVASLEQQGHRGRIIAFSRRGLLSRAHAAASHEPFGSFAHRAHAYGVRDAAVRSSVGMGGRCAMECHGSRSSTQCAATGRRSGRSWLQLSALGCCATSGPTGRSIATAWRRRSAPYSSADGRTAASRSSRPASARSSSLVARSAVS